MCHYLNRKINGFKILEANQKKLEENEKNRKKEKLKINYVISSVFSKEEVNIKKEINLIKKSVKKIIKKDKRCINFLKECGIIDESGNITKEYHAE